MTKGAAFLLALGLAAAALLHTGIWEYGDGFIFNRFSGDVIYVDLPEDADLTHVRDQDPARWIRPATLRAGRSPAWPRTRLTIR